MSLSNKRKFKLWYFSFTHYLKDKKWRNRTYCDISGPEIVQTTKNHQIKQNIEIEKTMNSWTFREMMRFSNFSVYNLTRSSIYVQHFSGVALIFVSYLYHILYQYWNVLQSSVEHLKIICNHIKEPTLHFG